MDDTPKRWRGNQANYDALSLTGEGACCICLSERSAELILAALAPYHWTTRFFSPSDTEILQETIDLWTDKAESEVMMAIGGCGCGVPFGAKTRWTAEGVLQISYDDGETWSDYPEGDERLSVPEYPVLTPPDGIAAACYAAQNLTGNVHATFDAWMVQLATIGTVALAVDGLAGILAIFTGGISLPVAAAIAGIAEAFLLGADAIDDAWSDEAYRALFCCCIEHIPVGGVINAGTIEDIRACFRDEIGGLAADLLDVLQLLEGTTAFANMAKVPAESEFDCDECDDLPELEIDWHFSDPPVGATVVHVSENIWTLSSVNRPGPGDYAAGFKDTLDRCIGVSEVISGGLGLFQYNTGCDNIEYDQFGTVVGSNAKRFQWTTSGGNYVITFRVILV